MRRMPAFAGLAAIAACSAHAQEATTLQFILAKGVSIHGELYGRPVDMQVTYNSDGTSLTKVMSAGGRGAEITGAWRVDAGRLCTVTIMNPDEACFDVPYGKQPGDTFKVMTPALGEATLTINDQP